MAEMSLREAKPSTGHVNSGEPARKVACLAPHTAPEPAQGRVVAPTLVQARTASTRARKTKAKTHQAKHEVPEIMVWVGLGNPGSGYKRTRHNLGFMVLDAVAEAKNAAWSRDRTCKAMTASFTDGGRQVYLLKPTTYMNLSGDAVRSAVKQLRQRHGADAIGPGNIVAVCDDLDLPLGRLKMKLKGSAGGHNGLRSIEQRLASQDYARLRAGISPSQAATHPNGRHSDGSTISSGQRSGRKREVHDFVLDRFHPAEHELLAAVVQNAREALLLLLREPSFDKCMTAINSKGGGFQAALKQ